MENIFGTIIAILTLLVVLVDAFLFFYLIIGLFVKDKPTYESPKTEGPAISRIHLPRD